MKTFLVKLTILMLAIPSFAKDYVYNKGMSFAEMDQLLRTAYLEKSTALLEAAAESYKTSCLELKKDFYKSYQGTLSCQFNLKSFAGGENQILAKGQLLKLPVSNIQGASVKLEKPVQYSVWIDSQPLDYNLNVLDYKKVILTNEKNNFLRNLSLRYAPYNHTLWANICSELPGMYIKTNISKVKVHAEKKLFWFLKAKAGIEIEMSLGEYWNKTAKLCGGGKLSYDKTKVMAQLNQSNLSQGLLAPELYLRDLEISPIHYKGIEVKKVHVSGRNLFTKIVLALFGKIRDQIKEQIKNELNKTLSAGIKEYVNITNQGLQDGSTWRKLAESTGISSQVKLVSSLNPPMIKAMREGASKTLELSPSEVKDQCQDFSKLILEEDGVKLSSTLCSQLIQKVSITPFYRNPTFEQKGCFEYNHLLFNYNSFAERDENLWWRQGCRLESQLVITTNPKFEGTYSCLLSGINNKWNSTTLIQKCSTTILSEFLEIKPQEVVILLKSQTLEDFFGSVTITPTHQKIIRQKVQLL